MHLLLTLATAAFVPAMILAILIAVFAAERLVSLVRVRVGQRQADRLLKLLGVNPADYG